MGIKEGKLWTNPAHFRVNYSAIHQGEQRTLTRSEGCRGVGGSNIVARQTGNGKINE